MIYLDNAATTMRKPQKVIDAVVQAMSSMGNAGRGVNDASLSASRIIYDTRERICRMVGGTNPRQVVFTCNSTESLNMALPLEDGLQVYVPDQEEAKELGAGAVTEAGAGFLSRGLIPGAAAVPGPLEKSRVNINTATREELMTLTGIGASRADAILAYRREAGPFQKIEDIMKVSGIKEAAFQKIKEDITV